jgi:hypothetical protein
MEFVVCFQMCHTANHHSRREYNKEEPKSSICEMLLHPLTIRMRSVVSVARTHGGPATLALEKCAKRRRVETKQADEYDAFSFGDMFSDAAQDQEAFPTIAWDSDDGEDEGNVADETEQALYTLKRATDPTASLTRGTKRQRSSQRCLQRSTAFTEDLVALEAESSTNLVTTLAPSIENGLPVPEAPYSVLDIWVQSHSNVDAITASESLVELRIDR